jgi:hypothetical protein
LSLLRTSTPRKSTKIKLAVSGLALAAAAGGAIGGWPAGAAAPSASGSSQARPVAPATSLASALAVPALAAPAGRSAAAAGQLDALDAFLAPDSSKPAPAGHRPVHYRRPARLTPKLLARKMLRSFHWSRWQFQWLNQLWSRESSWNVHASNPYSGAYGIPQAVPGSKMASAGPHWESSARTQIRWGMDYIKGRYGSPYGAWEHELATGWY